MRPSRRLLALGVALAMAAGCTGRTTPVRPPTPSPPPLPEAPAPTPAPSPVFTPEPTPPPVAAASPAPAPIVPPVAPPVRPTPAAPPRRPSPTPSPRFSPAATPTPSPAPAPQTGTVTGTLELVLDSKGNKGPAADAVVWIAGFRSGARSVPRLEQRKKAFNPHVVVVGKGGSVSFPNADRIFHNVFSRTPGSAFDLGLYKSGSTKERAFNNPGEVRVFCNIHPEMAAYVLVLGEADPLYGVADASGRVRLQGVPAGAQRLRIWHEKGGQQEVAVEVVPGRDVAFGAVLDASRWRKESHTDKWDEAYRRKNRY